MVISSFYRWRTKVPFEPNLRHLGLDFSECLALYNSAFRTRFRSTSEASMPAQQDLKLGIQKMRSTQINEKFVLPSITKDLCLGSSRFSRAPFNCSKLSPYCKLLTHSLYSFQLLGQRRQWSVLRATISFITQGGFILCSSGCRKPLEKKS